MNIKKSLLLLLTMAFVLSCTQDELKVDQTANLTNNQEVDISIYDNSNLGVYKGAFTTLDAAERGILNVEIFNNVPVRAALVLTSGRTYNLVSSETFTFGDAITNLRLSSEFTKDVVIDFSVNSDGTNPVFTNITLNGSESSILSAKETSRAPVVPITGTYLCTACGTHPTLGTGETQTFNMVYTGDGSGTDTIMTEITLDTTVFSSTATENNQGACVANGSFMDCPISGTTTVNPTNLINWTGTHSYDTVGDCSQAAGTWTYNSPAYGMLSGTFVSDSQCLPPVNDECAGAIAVSCGSVETATTSAATTTGEPTTFCGSTNPNGPGIWYIYTSTGAGDNVTVDTCGSNYDTKLFIYTDGCGTLTCLAGNDDSCGLQSSVTFNEGMTAGVEFLIYAAGFNGATGSFILNVNCVTPPPVIDNDTCATAEAITCTTSLTGVDITASTGTGNPTTACGTGSGGTPGSARGAWYVFTDTGNGDDITIDLSGSSFDTKIHVYTGSCGTFTCIASDDDGGTGLDSLVTFSEVGDGTTVYYVLVGAIGTGGAGTIDLNVSCAPPAGATPVACGTDTFIDNGGNPGPYDGGCTGGGCTATEETYLIDAGAGAVVSLDFSVFDLENNWDYMRFYDGDDEFAPEITTSVLGAVATAANGNDGFTGTTLNGDMIVSTGQFLTVRFESDDFGTSDEGWVASATCAAPFAGNTGSQQYTRSHDKNASVGKTRAQIASEKKEQLLNSKEK